MPSLGRTAPEAVRAAAWIAWGIVLLTAACGSKHGSLMVEVDVDPQITLPPVTRVDVTLSARGRAVVITTTGSAAAPVVFPLMVTLNTSGLPSSDTIVEANASDQTQTVVAQGTTSVTLPHSGVVRVVIQCQSLICSRGPPDGGADALPDVGANPDAPADPNCGNGQLDPGEQCDIARAPDLPGACPSNCDDGIACTQDLLIESGCDTHCVHSEIATPVPGDGCCPANNDHAADPDCSQTCGDGHVDPGEACDTGIGRGDSACPDEEACDDGDPCTRDQVVSKGTCSARCIHDPITTAGDDGCCPLGADATNDNDCHAMCGNGVREPGEMCDPGIAASVPGACPATSCDDNNPCTIDALVGTACNVTCSHLPITNPAPGDGCCPLDGLGRNIDPDCVAVCGNGLLEAGETCDRTIAAGLAGACPTSCPGAPSTCVRYELRGAMSDCTAACVATPVRDCSATADGCCPSGCTSASDPDCSATCGNGRVDAGERCDTAIATGTGACPLSCSDGVPCTDDLLVDAGTCSARCMFIPTTARRDGDGCCPTGAHAAVDADCPAVCGNGVVESPFETCDTATTPPSCPDSCPAAAGCSTWVRTVNSPCDVRCVRQMITACQDDDGCCAPGCNAGNDSDCAPVCGNGALEPPEGCDRGISAGNPGSCPASCTDTDPCTLDFAHGSSASCTRGCTHVRVTACGGGDRCCPLGCTADNDNDCGAPVCGDEHVQAGETCDPVATCPTSCASDGDPCTVDQLLGSPASCTAVCVHPPILSCSRTLRDGCCPTGCSTDNDSDC